MTSSLCIEDHNVLDKNQTRERGRTCPLTDGGPFVTPELPDGAAGPPFGEAPGVRLTWT